MGPGNVQSCSLPSRPKFSWDLRSPPWTDGCGNQEEFARSVAQWSKFHDGLPDSNSNKIGVPLRGICLAAQLFGRAKDLCIGLTSDELSSPNGTKLIVSKIYQRDAISVIAEVYKDFTDLIRIVRGQSESYKNFESRYAAQMSKFNANGNSIQFPEALSALMLLSNAGVDDAQRISILSSVATSSDDNVDVDAANDAYITSIKYGSVASIIRQCDRLKTSAPHDTPNSSNTIGSGLANTPRIPRRTNFTPHNPGSGNGNGNRNKSRLTPDQLADLKSKSQCRVCKLYGHWSTDHNPNGSLRSNVRSVPTPPGNSSNQSTTCLLYTSPSPRDQRGSRMPSSA